MRAGALQVRVAAALVQIAAQEEQAIENKQERVKAWSKAWLKKQQKLSGALLVHGASRLKSSILVTESVDVVG